MNSDSASNSWGTSNRALDNEGMLERSSKQKPDGQKNAHHDLLHMMLGGMLPGTHTTARGAIAADNVFKFKPFFNGLSGTVNWLEKASHLAFHVITTPTE